MKVEIVPPKYTQKRPGQAYTVYADKGNVCKASALPLRISLTLFPGSGSGYGCRARIRIQLLKKLVPRAEIYHDQRSFHSTIKYIYEVRYIFSKISWPLWLIFSTAVVNQVGTWSQIRIWIWIQSRSEMFGWIRIRIKRNANPYYCWKVNSGVL